MSHRYINTLASSEVNSCVIKFSACCSHTHHLMLWCCSLLGAAAPTTGLTLGRFLFLQYFWTKIFEKSLKTVYNIDFYIYFLSGTPATSAASTGFSLAFNKPTASAIPFSLTTTATTSSSAPAGAGLTFGSVLTSTAPQQPAASGFTLGLGSTTTTTPALTGSSLGGGLFSSTVSTGEMQTAGLSLSTHKQYRPNLTQGALTTLQQNVVIRLF